MNQVELAEYCRKKGLFKEQIEVFNFITDMTYFINDTKWLLFNIIKMSNLIFIIKYAIKRYQII